MKITDLTIQYGKNKLFEEVSLSFFCGLNAILGQSGSGKTSILNALTGTINASYTHYFINEVDISKMDNIQKQLFIRNNITYLTQETNFISDISCYDNLRLQGALVGKNNVDEDILSLIDKYHLPIDTKTYPNQLSGGEKQKLAICSALIKDSNIILCDEITASLDADSKKEIINLLEDIAVSHNKIVILSTHDQDVIDRCKNVYQIKEGKVHHISQQIDNENIQLKMDYSFLKKNPLIKYVLSKIDRKKWYFILSTLVFCLVTTICSFTIFFSINFFNEAKTHTALLEKNELFVVNKAIYSKLDTLVYDSNDLLINQNIINQIGRIDKLKQLYPYFDCPLGDIKEDGQLILTNNTTGKIKDITLPYAYDFKAIPYYPEQMFASKHTLVNQDDLNGIYISRDFIESLNIRLEALGMDNEMVDVNDLEDSSLDLSFLVPVAYTKSTSVYSDNLGTRVDIETNEPVLKKVNITLPISGIVEFNYHDYTSYPSIYIPYDILYSLQQKEIEDYQLQEDELSWNPNALYCYSENENELEALSNAIMKIDENLKTQNRYTSIINYQSDNKSLATISMTCFISLLLIGIGSSYVYSVVYYNKNKQDYFMFKRYGVTKKEIKTIFVTKICIQTFTNIMLSLPLLILSILYIYKNGYVSMTHNYISLLALITFIISLILSILSITKEMTSYD